MGFIIEFKKTRKKETLESAIKSALEQIEKQKYENELLHRGINNYKKLATRAQRHKETQRSFILRIKKYYLLCPLVSLCPGGKEKVKSLILGIRA